MSKLIALSPEEAKKILAWADRAAPISHHDWPLMRRLDEFVGIKWEGRPRPQQ